MNMSFFLEMAWKSSFIAGVALLLAMLLKSRSPADRATILQVGLGLLVLLPLVSLFLPAWQVEMAAEEAQPLVGSLFQHQAVTPAIPAAASPDMPPSVAPVAAASDWGDPTLIVAILYLGGLLMALTHLVGGLAILRRWTASAEPVSCPRWTQALERVSQAAGAAPVRLLVSDEISAPLSWGWRRPVILIDAEAYKRPEDAEAILAHEFAHVVRRDWPALMLSRTAAALFWFNPLVWLLGRAFIRHAEEAADFQALAQVEPIHYAKALIGCASHVSRSPVLANSIASSDLARRVQTVLDGSARAIPSGSRLCVATVLGCLAVAGPVSAMKLIPAAAVEAAAVLAPVTPRAPRLVQSMVAPAPLRPAPAEAVAAVAVAAAPKAPVAPAMPAASSVEVAPVAAIAAAATAASIAKAEVPAVQLAALSAASVAAEAAVPAHANERREYEAAIREAQAAGAEARRAGERAARAGERAGQIARRQARRSMAEGAVSMEKGAEDMRRGARHMAEEAVKLRDPAYREQQIAREAAYGRRVTHQELIDAIPQMEKGSRQMIQGAENMRRGAEQMRRQAEHQ